MVNDEDGLDPFDTHTASHSKNLPVVTNIEEDEDDFESIDPDRSRLSRFGKIVGVAIVLAALIATAFFLGSSYSKNQDASKNPNTTSGQTGGSAGTMTESQLRDYVISKKLTAYWSGPIPGYRYAIFLPKKGVVVIRYLPNGNGLDDTAPNYRVFGTYSQKGATEAVVSSGQKDGSLGFTNVDGNAVYYVRARPTNVYMAIKGKDIQVEIFDPGQDQAVALSLFKGQIQQIK